MSALLEGWQLDGRGGGRALDAPPAGAPDPRAPVWLHFDLDSPAATGWLESRPGLEPALLDALLASQTRPRFLPAETEAGAVMILRGVNLNPGAEPEDMVSLRLHVEPGRLMTVRRSPVRAAADLARWLEAGRGPATPGAAVLDLVDGLNARLVEVIEAMEAELEDLEDALDAQPAETLRAGLLRLRRRGIKLRRHIRPQLSALRALAAADPDWLAADETPRLAQDIDILTRAAESLDSLQAQARLLADDLDHRLAAHTGRVAYVLTVLAGVFLPLNLIGAMLGANVGGIPGADNPDGFWLMGGLMLAVLAVQIVLLRRMRWL